VLAIEFDRALIPALEEAVAPWSAVRVVHADATKLSWMETLGVGPWIFCANLPYNVGTSIVLDVLESVPVVERLVVMVQREVGERLAAPPGDEAYGAVSVHVAYWGRASLVRRVPREVFWPRPSVGSVIVRIDRRAAPPVAIEEERLWPVVDEAFAQRRKTMRNALRRLGMGLADADALLRGVGIDPRARPESLSLGEFARVAGALGE
jgi:16S rRNA (adenine1518-N6/adenine1519-N6)-dimethyltransferase